MRSRNCFWGQALLWCWGGGAWCILQECGSTDPTTDPVARKGPVSPGCSPSFPYLQLPRHFVYCLNWKLGRIYFSSGSAILFWLSSEVRNKKPSGRSSGVLLQVLAVTCCMISGNSFWTLVFTHQWNEAKDTYFIREHRFVTWNP